MEDIGIVVLVFAGCFIKWPVETATAVLSIPVSLGISLNEKLKERRNKTLTKKTDNIDNIRK